MYLKILNIHTYMYIFSFSVLIDPFYILYNFSEISNKPHYMYLMHISLNEILWQRKDSENL